MPKSRKQWRFLIWLIANMKSFWVNEVWLLTIWKCLGSSGFSSWSEWGMVSGQFGYGFWADCKIAWVLCSVHVVVSCWSDDSKRLLGCLSTLPPISSSALAGWYWSMNLPLHHFRVFSASLSRNFYGSLSIALWFTWIQLELRLSTHVLISQILLCIHNQSSTQSLVSIHHH